MRPLTEEETKTLFLKLSEYIGKNVEKMINRSDERHCFRLMKDRCYYISEALMKAASAISRENLLHVGTCIGKFTKSGKFRLHITAIEYLSQYAKVRLLNHTYPSIFE
jgi:60S ribosome subunit biogenesis protein NIP7